MKAAFLDRDGVINPLVYYEEQGIIDSPFTAEQFNLLPGIGPAISRLHQLGYKVILASNQPGVAKGHMTEAAFERIRNKMRDELARQGAAIDGERYCLHHPEAIVHELMLDCDCRKPKPGLLMQAAQDMGIDLSQSWMIGDGLTDVQAGKRAGCRTILLAKMKCELCRLMDEQEARPDAIAANLPEAVSFIADNST
ncbi:MAG: HAD family hydrolase [Dehalococcoidia bacterium]|nr:HAD family hydrolase [Dehalococcoidia bacterium]